VNDYASSSQRKTEEIVTPASSSLHVIHRHHHRVKTIDYMPDQNQSEELRVLQKKVNIYERHNYIK
jgi:hypothetical protein